MTLGRSRVLRGGGRLFGQFFVTRLAFQNRAQPVESAALFYFRADAPGRFARAPAPKEKKRQDVMNNAGRS
jgi:hypothetical protein